MEGSLFSTAVYLLAVTAVALVESAASVPVCSSDIQRELARYRCLPSATRGVNSEPIAITTDACAATLRTLLETTPAHVPRTFTVQKEAGQAAHATQVGRHARRLGYSNWRYDCTLDANNSPSASWREQ